MADDSKEKFDTTPEIHYKNGIARNVRTYCVVNGNYLANSDYSLGDGCYTESHFDEYHSICTKNATVPRSRFAELDRNNPRNISLLEVLGSDRASVEKHLAEKRIEARHLGK